MVDTTSIEHVERYEQQGGAREWLAGFEEGEMSPPRIVAVMVLGAFTSLAAYYFYSTLTPETKDNIKDQLMGTVKSNINKFTQA